MPFINLKITEKTDATKKQSIVSKLGKAIAIMGKPESYLMINIEDEQNLYFGGKKLDKGAYLEVSVFGGVNSSSSNQMTGKICEILAEELSIPGNCVYVSYHPVDNWGWNGQNF